MTILHSLANTCVHISIVRPVDKCTETVDIDRADRPTHKIEYYDKYSIIRERFSSYFSEIQILSKRERPGTGRFLRLLYHTYILTAAGNAIKFYFG